MRPGWGEPQPLRSVFRIHFLCFTAEVATGGLKGSVAFLLLKDMTPATAARFPHTKGLPESPWVEGDSGERTLSRVQGHPPMAEGGISPLCWG